MTEHQGANKTQKETQNKTQKLRQEAQRRIIRSGMTTILIGQEHHRRNCRRQKRKFEVLKTNDKPEPSIVVCPGASHPLQHLRGEPNHALTPP